MTGVRARLKRILGINPETPEPLGNQKKYGLAEFPKDPCPDPCGRPRAVSLRVETRTVNGRLRTLSHAMKKKHKATDRSKLTSTNTTHTSYGDASNPRFTRC